ncbi:MAG: hypothetical protein EBQ97_04985, partial [Bacteroidetes bacterium]|nr:hypothetical protein [Bacteroidota bacterium]
FWLGFKRAVADYKRAFPQIWQVALPVIVLSAVISLLHSFSGPGINVVTIFGALARIVFSILTALVVPGIFIASVGNDQPFDLKSAYMAAIKKAPLFFVYSALVVLVLFPTTVFFFVPGVYFSLMLGFFAYSYFLGSPYHSNPLVDSYMHVQGFFWQVVYRLIASTVIIFALCFAALVVFLVGSVVFGFVIRSVGVLSPAVVELVGSVIFEAFLVLVPMPLYYLYGRILFKDLEQARGYTYADEEKRRASQVVLWVPIISVIGAVVSIVILAKGTENFVRDMQMNLQQARDRNQVEHIIPARGLNR